MKNILCYGDSNTWGFIPGTGERLEKDRRWTGVVQNRLGSGYRIIEDGINGLVFKLDDLDSLETKVMSLLENEEYRRTIARNAIHTMRATWSPANAARQFLKLISAIQTGDNSLIPMQGPCSKAKPI